MNDQPTYEELAEILALHIHDHWRHERPELGMVFEHTFTSSLQLAAGVLKSLKIIQEIKGRSSLFLFTCKPDQFKELAQKNKAHGCVFDILILSIYKLLDYGNEKKLCNSLTRLQICRPAKPDDYVPDANGKVNIFTLEDVNYDLAWTDKKAFYDDLWPRRSDFMK